MLQWEIKENPKWKTCFWEGGKNSSELLNSCNEDNLIKIKAKLIKDLKVRVFGCIISLKHGRMGLLSSVEFLVLQTGDASGSQWKCTAGLQFPDHSFWPFCSLLIFLLFCFWKKTPKNTILTGNSPSLLWVFSGNAAGDKLAVVYQFIVFIHGFHGSFLDLTILKWGGKKSMFTHTSP